VRHGSTPRAGKLNVKSASEIGRVNEPLARLFSCLSKGEDSRLRSSLKLFLSMMLNKLPCSQEHKKINLTNLT
jgi:hypothetical protein